MSTRVLVFGCGVVGGFVIDLLSRLPDDLHITVACRNIIGARERANLAIAVAMNLECSPNINCEHADLNDVEETAGLIRRLKPELVVNATSIQTFWIISLLPERHFRSLQQACIGPWLPNHLALARKLMLAIGSSGLRPIVVNASFPDAVNPVLSRVGLGPTTGAGNIANSIPTLRRAVAAVRGVPTTEVEIRFVAHHYVGDRIASSGTTNGAPFHLSVFEKGIDISGQLLPSDLFHLFATDLKRVRGIAGQIMAASSIVALVRAFLRDRPTLLHAPGPLGEIGGYPVSVSSQGVELALPSSISLPEAREINEGGQLYEGIESIDGDGTVTFAPAQMAVLRETFGYECRRMQVADVDDWAAELQRKYRAFADRVMRESGGQQYATAKA